MAVSTTQFLNGQLAAYSESWQDEHASALACWELEARIKLAVALFEIIRDFDERLARDALAGKMQWDRPLADEIRELYAAWEKPTARIVPQLLEMSKGGFVVEGEEAFKGAVLDARSMLSFSLDRLEESARQAREGKTRSLAEVADGIRRRLGA
jgi:hypothetical protein